MNQSRYLCNMKRHGERQEMQANRVLRDPTDHAPAYDPRMADDFYRPNRPLDPPRQPQAGEHLFEFYREADQARFMCELRECGEYGVEAQFFQNEELLIAWRWPTRELAMAWAERERRELENAVPLL
jgi:hypothetical protein